MELINKRILAFVIYVSITTIYCSANFRISKWNTCPPEESKFLSLEKISLEVCIDECFRRNHCFAAGYKRLYTLCELYTEFTPASTNRGHCVIVKKDDIQSPDESINADQSNECGEWQANQSTGTESTCSKQECQRQEILENEVHQGNMNEIGSKIVSCKRNGNGVVDVQALECSSSGEWEISSTVDRCSSVVARMTQLYCSQSKIQIFTTTMSQPDAAEFCSTVGGKLVKIDEKWKFDAIQALIRDCPGLNTGQYWVDGYNERNKVDDWKFSDDTLVPMGKHFWKDKAPNGQKGDPSCMRMVRHSDDRIGDHRFDDIECWKTFHFICEQN
ncbi:uncharacterized protein LOC132760515 [Ruditapes philippinarum]|uniref:uncharacterized protein LOC132760515 n=1 Tax=Ruditapes philippinarum TaxID=129788 RepID=UPI00295ADF53|nr:uncharacterized protein LOC132760515 [Ruditapes philippinarum]